jgi:hypothetical protein
LVVFVWFYRNIIVIMRVKLNISEDCSETIRNIELLPSRFSVVSVWFYHNTIVNMFPGTQQT